MIPNFRRLMILVSWLTISIVSGAYGQTPAAPELNLTLGEQRVKFAPTRSFQEMRLEVVNSVGEIVFTHTTTEAEFDWNLRAANNESLAPGLYRYALTLKFSEEQTRQHTGHFIVEKGQDQIWLTASDGAEVSGTTLNAARSGGRSLAGFRTSDDKAVKRDVSGRELVDEKGNKLPEAKDDKKSAKQEKAALLGTANMVAKFDATGLAANVVDSAITETGGNVGIGTLGPNAKLSVTANIGMPPTEVGIIGYFANANENNTFITADSYGNSVVHSDFLFRRARGTMAAPTAVQTDDIVGQIQMRGYGATGFATTARAGIRMTAAQNWSDAAQGAYLAFMTNPIGSAAINVERMRITDAGNVGIGTTNPSVTLDVAGAINSATQYNLNGNRILSNAGNENLFAGVGAGAANTGTNNAFFGASAGQANTTGSGNAFFGNLAGAANTTGVANAFFGLTAGAANTTGANNSFFGTNAGKVNTTGNGNTFFGANAGLVNTTGGNAFFGASAGQANTTASNNAFFGLEAGRFNTTGGDNAFFGQDAGRLNTTGFSNAFFGKGAGRANTTANSNSFFGVGAGAFNTTANSNAFFGASAGNGNTTGASNAFFGAGAGFANTTAGDNAYFGHDAGRVNTTGADNAFFGANAGDSNTTGGFNAFFGRNAGQANTIGGNNAFFGESAGLTNTTGGTNAFFGSDAGFANTTGGSNAFFGTGAGSANTTGINNSFFGTSAGSANTTGNNTTIIGKDADVGVNNLTFATALGAGAVVSNNNSVVLGRSTDTVRVPGSAIVTGNLTISGNTIITLGTPSASQNICINGSNEIVDCTISSIRHKKNITPLKAGLAEINRLRPVNFTWKTTDEKDVGLIAEEVAASVPMLALHEKDGTTVKGVKYDQLSLLLINAVKEQQTQIQQQQRQLQQVLRANRQWRHRLTRLERRATTPHR